MNSIGIEKLLKKHRVETGDTIIISFKGTEKTGIVMPNNQFSNPEILTIKMANGYNMGILASNVKSIKKVEKEKVRGSIKRTNLKFDKKRPLISAVITGGTIASKIDYRTGGVTGLSDANEILSNIPELSEIANVNCVSPFTKMSEDIGYEDWTKIAKIVAKELNSGSKGTIVAHGTDFLHFTSSALSFMLKNLSKPVVLVGSQRSSDRGSSDAGMNIICGAYAATSDIAEVGICMHGTTNDDYCLFSRGTKVRKMHTSRRDAFRPINEPPLAKIWTNGKIEKMNQNIKKRTDENVKVDVKFEPKIAILKVYPGSDPGIIDYYISKGYKGFVMETPGLGHVPTLSNNSWIDTIKKHTKDGIPFITTAQTIYGRLNSSVYTNLRMLYHHAGAICGEDMLTETAFVKLGWVLGHTTDFEEVKNMMLTNISGEMTKRILPSDYLY